MLPFVNYNHWTGLMDWTGGMDWWTVKVTLTRSSSVPKNPSLLHWLVSLLCFPTESPRGMRRMKISKSYGGFFHHKKANFLNQWDTNPCTFWIPSEM